MMMSRLCAFAAVVLVGESAMAAPLAPGGLMHPIPLEYFPDPSVFDTLGAQTVPFVAPTFSGTLTSVVVRDDPTNPFPGGLTFLYRLTVQEGAHSIERLAINGFEGFLADVNYQSDPALTDVAPGYLDREVSGNSIGFSFALTPLGFGKIGAGQQSALLAIRTNATAWMQSTASVIDGFTATAGTFAPVPEPGATVLAGSGLAAAIGHYVWRCRRRSS